MALESQGVIIFWSTSTAASTAAADVVGEVVSFSGPGGNAAVIDVTHLGSTAKEKMMGLPDEGQLTLECNLAPTDTGQIGLRSARAARAKKKAVIKLTDSTSAPTKLIFDAYCLNFSINGSVDNKISASIGLEIAGPCTWTTGAI